MEETMTTRLKDSCWVVVPGYRYLLLHTYTKQIFLETMCTEVVWSVDKTQKNTPDVFFRLK